MSYPKSDFSKRVVSRTLSLDYGMFRAPVHQPWQRVSFNYVRRFHSLKEKPMPRIAPSKFTNTHLPRDVYCRLPQYPSIDNRILARTSFRVPIYKTGKPVAPVVVDLARSKFTINRLKCPTTIMQLRSSHATFVSTTFSMSIRSPSWDGDPRLLRRTVSDMLSPPRHFMSPSNPQRELDWSRAAHERLAVRRRRYTAHKIVGVNCLVGVFTPKHETGDLAVERSRIRRKLFTAFKQVAQETCSPLLFFDVLLQPTRAVLTQPMSSLRHEIRIALCNLLTMARQQRNFTTPGQLAATGHLATLPDRMSAPPYGSLPEEAVPDYGYGDALHAGDIPQAWQPLDAPQSPRSSLVHVHPLWIDSGALAHDNALDGAVALAAAKLRASGHLSERGNAAAGTTPASGSTTAVSADGMDWSPAAVTSPLIAAIGRSPGALRVSDALRHDAPLLSYTPAGTRVHVGSNVWFSEPGSLHVAFQRALRNSAPAGGKGKIAETAVPVWPRVPAPRWSHVDAQERVLCTHACYTVNAARAVQRHGLTRVSNGAVQLRNPLFPLPLPPGGDLRALQKLVLTPFPHAPLPYYRRPCWQLPAAESYLSRSVPSVSTPAPAPTHPLSPFSWMPNPAAAGVSAPPPSANISVFSTQHTRDAHSTNALHMLPMPASFGPHRAVPDQLVWGSNADTHGAPHSLPPPWAVVHLPVVTDTVDGAASPAAAPVAAVAASLIAAVQGASTSTASAASLAMALLEHRHRAMETDFSAPAAVDPSSPALPAASPPAVTAFTSAAAPITHSAAPPARVPWEALGSTGHSDPAQAAQMVVSAVRGATLIARAVAAVMRGADAETLRGCFTWSLAEIDVVPLPPFIARLPAAQRPPFFALGFLPLFHNKPFLSLNNARFLGIPWADAPAARAAATATPEEGPYWAGRVLIAGAPFTGTWAPHAQAGAFAATDGRFCGRSLSACTHVATFSSMLVADVQLAVDRALTLLRERCMALRPENVPVETWDLAAVRASGADMEELLSTLDSATHDAIFGSTQVWATMLPSTFDHARLAHGDCLALLRTSFRYALATERGRGDEAAVPGLTTPSFQHAQAACLPALMDSAMYSTAPLFARAAASFTHALWNQCWALMSSRATRAHGHALRALAAARRADIEAGRMARQYESLPCSCTAASGRCSEEGVCTCGLSDLAYNLADPRAHYDGGARVELTEVGPLSSFVDVNALHMVQEQLDKLARILLTDSHVYAAAQKQSQSPGERIRLKNIVFARFGGQGGSGAVYGDIPAQWVGDREKRTSARRVSRAYALNPRTLVYGHIVARYKSLLRLFGITSHKKWRERTRENIKAFRTGNGIVGIPSGAQSDQQSPSMKASDAASFVTDSIDVSGSSSLKAHPSTRSSIWPRIRKAAVQLPRTPDIPIVATERARLSMIQAEGREANPFAGVTKYERWLFRNWGRIDKRGEVRRMLNFHQIEVATLRTYHTHTLPPAIHRALREFIMTLIHRDQLYLVIQIAPLFRRLMLQPHITHY